METKKRHGCLTAWLVLLVLVNGFSAVSFLFYGEAISENLGTTLSQNTLWITGALAVLNLIFAFMLFSWKKWAFWGLLLTSLLAFGLNIYHGLGIINSAIGLLGIVLLYGLLQMKHQGKSGWEQLS